MIKINNTYSIIKGWPRATLKIAEGVPSVSAYIVEKQRLTPFKLTYEEYKVRIAERLEIEEQIKINDQLAAEGNDPELKKFYNTTKMIYSDTTDLPYPSVYDGDKIEEIFKAETEVEIEIDDYFKQLVEGYLEDPTVINKSSLDKTIEEPIWVIKKT